MFEPDISMLVEMAGKLRGIQDPREHLLRVRSSEHPTQHLRGAVPPILAVAMGKMMLDIVIGPPRLVCLLDLRPGACIGECIVGEPSLNGEEGLRVILPRLSRLDAFLADTKHVIELHRLIAVEDPTTISHDRFWSAVATEGVGQDREVVPLILR